MAALGNLKKCWVPPLFSMKVLFIEDKIKKIISQKQSEKSSSVTKLAEKGQKRIFQERKKEVEVGSQQYEKRDHCDR